MRRGSAEQKQCRLRVSGRVQGVGFRVFVRREAVRLGLAGWVRNLECGDVELTVKGPAPAVDELLAKVRKGPPLSWVSGVSADLQPPDPALRGFDVKPTAW